MKKKFLSLMMAAAVVATTSVSAFADDTTTNLTQSETSAPTADVTITGKVIDDEGNEPVGNFNVTVPTTAAFMVSQQGDLEGTKINIKNNGQQNIDVYAEKFVDTTRTEGDGITVVKESLLKDKNRTYVSLKVYGKTGNVYLKTESDAGEKGLYTDNGLLTKATTEDQLRLTSIGAGQNADLTLEGKAGDKTKNDDAALAVTKAVSNDFTLTLKIKKSANQ